MKFHSTRLKIQRAEKHIFDLNELVERFIESDFYSIRVERYTGNNSLWFDIDKSLFSLTDAALIIGDALHNLKSERGPKSTSDGVTVRRPRIQVYFRGGTEPEAWIVFSSAGVTADASSAILFQIYLGW